MSEINDEKIIGPDIDNRFKLQFYGHVHKQSSSCDGVIKIYSGALQPPEEENNKEYIFYVEESSSSTFEVNKEYQFVTYQSVVVSYEDL